MFPYILFCILFFISSRVGWSTDVARIIPKLMKGPHYFNQQEKNAERKMIDFFLKSLYYEKHMLSNLRISMVVHDTTFPLSAVLM